MPTTIDRMRTAVLRMFTALLKVVMAVFSTAMAALMGASKALKAPMRAVRKPLRKVAPRLLDSEFVKSFSWFEICGVTTVFRASSRYLSVPAAGEKIGDLNTTEFAAGNWLGPPASEKIEPRREVIAI